MSTSGQKPPVDNPERANRTDADIPAAVAAEAATRTERLNTKAAGIIGLAVMCSRVLGLAREVICAALFGGGGAMDAFTAAFRIPNLLRDLFAEGALSTAFVTTFSKTIARGGDAAAWRLADKVATLTTLVLSAVCVLGIVLSPQLVATLAPGFDIGQSGADGHADTDHVSVHSAGVDRGPGHGHAERQERIRHAGDGLELFQYRLHRRRGAARGLARSAVRSARAHRSCDRYADRRRSATGRAVAAAAPARLSLSTRFCLARCRRQGDPGAHGTVGHSCQYDAAQCAGQLDVRFGARRWTDFLAGDRVSPDAAAAGPVRRRARNGDTAAAVAPCGRRATWRRFEASCRGPCGWDSC